MFFINKEFAALGLHNILFSDDYKRNLIIYFQNNANRRPYYLHQYYSKYCKDDAPEGCETGLSWSMYRTIKAKYTVYISY
jgi:hypothetical protein